MDARIGGRFGLVRETLKDFAEDECPMRAAALSYYTIFALPPLLVLILLVVSAFVDANEVQRMLTGQFRGVMGVEGARGIEAMIRSAERPDMSRGLAAVISVGGLLFGATGAFMQLQGALNRAWGVEAAKGGGVRGMLVKRVLSLGMILVVAFLVLVSLVLSTAISAMGDTLAGALGGGIGTGVQTAIDLGLSLAVITVVFAAIFRVLPDAHIAWRDVWVGALATAALFVVGKFAIGFYLGRSNPGEAFGAAGSLAIVLVWIYYSSLIVLMGAEFTETWAVRRGAGIRPQAGAVRSEAGSGGADSGRAVPPAARRPTLALDAARARRAAGEDGGGPSTLAVLAAALVDRFTGGRRRR